MANEYDEESECLTEGKFFNKCTKECYEPKCDGVSNTCVKLRGKETLKEKCVEYSNTEDQNCNVTCND